MPTNISVEKVKELIRLAEAGARPRAGSGGRAVEADAPEFDRVAFIISRPDLTRCLRAALERM